MSQLTTVKTTYCKMKTAVTFAAFILALMATYGNAQLDSCEGCLATMTVLTTWASSPEVVQVI